MIRVVLISKYAMVRAGIKAMLEADPGIIVTGEAASVIDAVNVVSRQRPSVVLVNPCSNGESLHGAIKEFARVSPYSRILVLTSGPRANARNAARFPCSDGVVLTSQTGASLLEAVKKVSAGDVGAVRSKTKPLTCRSRDHYPEPGDGSSKIGSLTCRELEIVKLVSAGLVNKEIASLLSISERTVRNHLTIIFSKLEVSGRLKLGLFAMQAGIHRDRVPHSAIPA